MSLQCIVYDKTFVFMRVKHTLPHLSGLCQEAFMKADFSPTSHLLVSGLLHISSLLSCLEGTRSLTHTNSLPCAQCTP